MHAVRVLCASALLMVLCGCGSSPSGSGSNPTPPAITVPALNGNWEIQAVSQVSGTNYLVGGNLATSGSNVSGILHILNVPSCYVTSGGLIYDIPVTGTISSTGSLSLTSAPVQNQTLTFSGTWSGGNIVNGSYSVVGGCGGGDHGTITGFPVPAFNGTYTGTFTSVTGVQIKTTISISQTATPNSDGAYGLSGTATFSNSPCFTSGPIASDASDDYSYVIGGFVQTEITTGNGLVIFDGVITDSTGNTITGNYSVTGGSGCAGDYGMGSASR